MIKRLTELYMCEDCKCSFTGLCWVDAEHTAHINLTHLHLQTWASAIVRCYMLSITALTVSQVSGHDGVDEQHPPNVKPFDSTSATASASADVASLAKH